MHSLADAHVSSFSVWTNGNVSTDCCLRLSQKLTPTRTQPPIIDDYRSIVRFLSVAGEATEIILCGPNACGVPQGCPIAAVLGNLAAVAKHNTCLRVAPTQPNAYYSYIDDRLSLNTSWRVVQQILDTTQRLDASFGPDLNASMSNPRNPLAREPTRGTLRAIKRPQTQVPRRRRCPTQDQTIY